MKLSNFQIATEAARMKPLFQERIEIICGKKALIESLYVTRVFPRKEGGFSIGYELRLEDDRPHRKLILWGHLLGPVQTLPGNRLEPRHDLMMFPEINLTVPVFPYDPRLKQLKRFYGTDESIRNMLANVAFPDRGDLKLIDCQLLGYRVERRCVLKYVLELGQKGQGKRTEIIAKLISPKKIEKIINNIRGAADNGLGASAPDGLTTATLLGYDKEKGVILMEFAPGESLHAMLGREAFLKSCGDAGRMLRKLHSISITGLEVYSPDDELDSLREKIDIVSDVVPDFSVALRDTYAVVARGKIADGYPAVPVHRDFYDKQTLHRPGRTTLLDLDNLALSDPALDYGNFMAHLILRGAQTPEYGHDVKKGSELFAAGYGIVDEQFIRRAAWWRGASLLRLALLYSLRPRWKNKVPQLLSDVTSLMERINVLTGEKR